MTVPYAGGSRTLLQRRRAGYWRASQKAIRYSYSLERAGMLFNKMDQITCVGACVERLATPDFDAATSEVPRRFGVESR